MFSKDGCLKISQSPHGPHNIIPSLINPHTTILDIGCNTGLLGKSLKNKHVIADGIDINTKALKIAKKYYRKIYCRDLTSGKLNINHDKYDYIILSDILEHLPRPDTLLKECAKYLNKNSLLIISLPNIGRFEIRLKLLFGKFDYTGGIMNPDHLRFFTYESSVNLIKHCGFEVIRTIPTGLGHIIKIFPTLTAFQYIFICKN